MSVYDTGSPLHVPVTPEVVHSTPQADMGNSDNEREGFAQDILRRIFVAWTYKEKVSRIKI